MEQSSIASSEHESTIHKVWCDILKKPEINRDDDFFSIGGNSMLAAQLVLQLEKNGIDASIQEIHDMPSIAAFADSKKKDNETAVEQLFEWSKMEKEMLTDSIGRRAIHGEEATVAHLYLAAGAVVPVHQHHNEQYTIILKGKLKFTLGEKQDRVKIVEEGAVLYIPGNVPHKAEALEDTIDLDIFAPVREDWRDGTDTYFTENQ